MAKTRSSKCPLHPSITAERVIAMVEDDGNEGICRACGAEAGGCEPDMRGGICDNCGAAEVYGAEELLLEVS